MIKKTASATSCNNRKSFKKDSEAPFNFDGNAGYRKLQLPKIELICHPSAKDAYYAWDSIPKRPQVSAIHLSLKSCLFNAPIYLIKAQDTAESRSKIRYFFEEFETIQYYRGCIDQSVQFPALEVQAPNVEIIELRAWSELVKLIFSNTLDPHLGSAWLLSAINKMPLNILKQLFGSLSLSVADFRELRGISENQYDNQLKHLREYQKLNQKSDVKINFSNIVSQANAKN